MLNGTFLLAANFNSGKIEVYNTQLQPHFLFSGSFTDPKLPAGYAPFGIHVIGNQIYVAYAMQNPAKRNAQAGLGVGQVDIFDMNGNFVSTFVASGGQLNAPVIGCKWRPHLLSETFPNAILVGILAMAPSTRTPRQGSFLGKLTNSSGTMLVNPSLWDMVLWQGASPSGDPGTLYSYHGWRHKQCIRQPCPRGRAVSGQNFSLNLSAPSVSVAPGGSANLMVSASAVGGFNGQISLSCASSAGLTCTFSPSTISPGSTTPSTLTISAAATPPVTGYGFIVGGLTDPANWDGAVRNCCHGSQPETSDTQNRSGYEDSGLAAFRLTNRTVRRRVRR